MKPSEYAALAAVSPPAKPASPSVGYPSNGDAGLLVDPTSPGAFWYYQLQAELEAVLSAGGQIANSDTLDQLLSAIQALIVDGINGTSGFVLKSGSTMTGGLILNPTGIAGAIDIRGILNSRMNIGRIDGITSSPYIGFNSGATAVTWDAQIRCLFGDGTEGQGDLLITSKTLTHNGSVVHSDLTHIRYYPGEQAIPADGATLTLTHGLGARPREFKTNLRCITTDLGYAVGTEVCLPEHGFATNPSIISRGGATSVSATEYKVKVGADGIWLYHDTTGISTAIDPTKWRLIPSAKP